MGITAENLEKKYKITRQEADEYAAKSQQRWRLGLEFFVFGIQGFIRDPRLELADQNIHIRKV